MYDASCTRNRALNTLDDDLNVGNIVGWIEDLSGCYTTEPLDGCDSVFDAGCHAVKDPVDIFSNDGGTSLVKMCSDEVGHALGGDVCLEADFFYNRTSKDIRL